MNIINIKESLQNMDIQTDFKHNLTTLYECLILDEAKKKELVQYIDAYDIDATNKFLSNEFSSQGLMEYYEDDVIGDEDDDFFGKEEIKECGDTEEIEEKPQINESLDEKALRTDIENTVQKFMSGLGFDSNDIKDYTVIEVSPTEDGDMLKVEVRAELGYTDLTALADSLDTVVKTYDSSAYFEPVTSGIIEAFVSIEETEDEVSPIVVEHWTNRFRECTTLEELRDNYLEYKEEKEFMSESTQEEINIVLDVIIDQFTAEGKADDIFVEEFKKDLQEGVFGKIGNAIKNRASNVKNQLRAAKGRIDAAEKEKHKEFAKKDQAQATANIKDLMRGDIDPTRAGEVEKELHSLDKRLSGAKVASAPDYSKNKKTTTKKGKELEKKISDEAKKGRVYTADIGESLVEDYVDDDISFFKDDYIISNDDDVITDFTFKATKSVPDSDGFNTDYTWYECADGTHVFVFGDNDIYKPQDGYFDHTCDTEEEAQEWFNSYNGFTDDEIVDEDINTLANDCKKVADDMKKTMNNASNLTESSDVEDDLDESKKRKGSLLDKVNKSLKESDEVEKVYTKKNGDYLVKGDNGGYQAFSKDDVHLGHIDEEDRQEAQFKFDKNQFTESKSIKEEIGDNYSNNVEYCPSCGEYLDGSDISYESDNWVRYTCYHCGNSFDRTKYYNESKSIEESFHKDGWVLRYDNGDHYVYWTADDNYTPDITNPKIMIYDSEDMALSDVSDVKKIYAELTDYEDAIFEPVHTSELSTNESESINEGIHRIYVDGELKDEIESSNPVHEVDSIAYKYKKLKGVKEVRVEYADGTTHTMQVESKSIKEDVNYDDEEQYAYVVHFDEDGQNMDNWFYADEKEKAIKYAKENLIYGPVLYEIDEDGIEDAIDYFFDDEIDESKSIKEDVDVIYQKGNKKIVKDGYGYAIDDGINANRFYVDDNGEPKFDDGCNSKFWLDKVNSLIKAGKLTSRKNESKSTEEEKVLTEGSLLDKVNAALAREENTVMESVDDDIETESDEWYVGDDVSGYMYKGEEAAKKAYDFLVKRGIKNPVMQRATE